MTERKMVPIVPSDEIIDAMVSAMTLAGGYQYPKKLCRAAYDAALAAAPAEPSCDCIARNVMHEKTCAIFKEPEQNAAEAPDGVTLNDEQIRHIELQYQDDDQFDIAIKPLVDQSIAAIRLKDIISGFKMKVGVSIAETCACRFDAEDNQLTWCDMHREQANRVEELERENELCMTVNKASICSNLTVADLGKLDEYKMRAEAAQRELDRRQTLHVGLMKEQEARTEAAEKRVEELEQSVNHLMNSIINADNARDAAIQRAEAAERELRAAQEELKAMIANAIIYRRQIHEAQEELGAKQATIDNLMLEYCPDEMSNAQVGMWGENQVASADQEPELSHTFRNAEWEAKFESPNGGYKSEEQRRILAEENVKKLREELAQYRDAQLPEEPKAYISGGNNFVPVAYWAYAKDLRNFAARMRVERDKAVADAERWRYWRSVWFDIGVNYLAYRAITNAGDIETVEKHVDAAIRALKDKP